MKSSSEVMLGTDGSHDIGSATIKVGLQESHVGVLFNNNVHDSAQKSSKWYGLRFGVILIVMFKI